MAWQDPATHHKDTVFDDELDGNDFDVPPDLLVELHMEEIVAGLEPPNQSKKDKVFTDIIKQPAEGEVRLEGRTVFRGNIKCGCLNFFVALGTCCNGSKLHVALKLLHNVSVASWQ